MRFFKKTVDYLNLIKFSHSIFALPFAFTGAILSADGIPPLREIFWITLAMVGARSGAMGLNRIIDRKIDAINPRTKDRELPRGVIKTWEAVIFTSFSLAIFVLSAYKLNPLCLKLSPLAIIIILIYPYTKRFTSLSHVILGLALSLAPMGAWIAIRGGIDLEIIPLSVAVLFWVAGFDIFYALQDIDFDRGLGLFSLPSRLGIKGSLLIARIFHLITVVMLLSLIPLFKLGRFYIIGILIAIGILIYEHSLVTPSNLTKIDMAFFNMNGYMSVTVFTFTLLDYLL